MRKELWLSPADAVFSSDSIKRGSRSASTFDRRECVVDRKVTVVGKLYALSFRSQRHLCQIHNRSSLYFKNGAIDWRNQWRHSNARTHPVWPTFDRKDYMLPSSLRQNPSRKSDAYFILHLKPIRVKGGAHYAHSISKDHGTTTAGRH